MANAINMGSGTGLTEFLGALEGRPAHSVRGAVTLRGERRESPCQCAFWPLSFSGGGPSSVVASIENRQPFRRDLCAVVQDGREEFTCLVDKTVGNLPHHLSSQRF